MVTIDGYEIDAVPSEDHSFASEVTSHPVEEGADITDHVRAQPITVSLDCVVSDTPVGEMATRRGDVDADGVPMARPSSVAFERLVAIRDARQPVVVETALHVYRDMVLQSLSVPRAVGNGDALRFRATFVQVKLVKNERTFVQVATPRAAKKVNLGHKPAQEVKPEDVPAKARERASVLAGGSGAIGDLLGLLGG